jgi:RNA polymerase sigma factor (sigma-70 family)
VRRVDPLAEPEPLIRRVYAYVSYRIGDGPHAEDVTSEVIERALRYRRSYDASQGEPIAWLLGIARRCLSDAAAGRSDERRDPPDTAASGDLESDVVARLTLAEALASLSARDRELVGLRYGADLSARQIATVLDERPNTVEVALHRALGRLRTFLTAERERAL